MMNWLKLERPAVCILALMSFTIDSDLFANEDSRPELPADCQVHVIGIYRPENSNQKAFQSIRSSAHGRKNLNRLTITSGLMDGIPNRGEPWLNRSKR